MKHLSIKTKTLLIGLLPLAITTFILSAGYIWQRVNDIDAALNNSLQMTASIISSAAEFDVVTQNHQALQKLISAYASGKNIVRIEIFGKKDQLLAHTIHHAAEKQNGADTVTQESQLIIIKKPISAVTIEMQDYEREVEPVVRTQPPAEPIGFVVITGTSRYAQSQKLFLLIQGVTFTLIAIIITALFAYYLARTLSTPLANIAQGVAKIAEGQFDQRLSEDSGGEIGQLQKHINDMAAALGQARELERKQAAHLLYIEKSKALTTLESLGEGVITTDTQGVITYINPAAVKLTGFSAEEATGNHLHHVFRTVNANSRQAFDYPILSCIEFGTVIRHDALLRLLRREGDEIVIRDTATTIRDQHQNAIGAVLIFDDFTSLHAMAERLVYQASHDDLTGLFNRREFEKQLELGLQEIHQQAAEHVLCYIDLDQFKIINDSCGHAAGDELLRQLGQLIKGKIRAHDILARLGGDEFGVIIKDCPGDKAKTVAENILDALSRFIFIWGERRQQIGASIGLVTLNKTQLSLTDVLIAADSACYVAKEQGRNRIHTYTTTDNELFKRRGEMQWFQRIKDALHNEAFVLYVQSITPLQASNTKANHYEVLLRLRNDDQLYSPEVFLTTAERYNLMPQIDRWVIENTLNTLRDKIIQGHLTDNAPRFNINLSGQSLGQEDFHEFVHKKLIQSGISPSLITFEITETAAITNLSRAIAFMKMFRELGCHFALDDFGSGLSSFGYLTTLPVDYIKIDGKLISAMTTSPINHSIVDAINRIAHQMHLITIAEYVEDKILIERLRAMGVDYGQGFALAPLQPMSTLLVPAR
jgi:diguanylate cyclase (GGDEF)-like protein/PAS domain S-box-containing protein